MLNNLNSWTSKFMPILTPLSLVIGVLFQQVGEQLLFLVAWLFAFMTFASSLRMNFEDAKSVRKHPLPILLSIAFLHIIMPIWAYFLSKVIFDDHLLTIGFIISVAVPTGVTSVIWVNITRGNLPLCLSIILIDTLLAPLLLPVVLKVAVGTTIHINSFSLIIDLLWMIVLPTILGIILNELTKGKITQTLAPKLAPFAKLSLFGVIAINSSAIAPFLSHITWELLAIILLVLFIASSGYAIALVLGRLLWKDDSVVTTFVFTGGMRNIAVGVIIATTYFPAKVAMPVLAGMLFQQVLASLYSKGIEKLKPRYATRSV